MAIFMFHVKRFTVPYLRLYYLQLFQGIRHITEPGVIRIFKRSVIIYIPNRHFAELLHCGRLIAYDGMN